MFKKYIAAAFAIAVSFAASAQNMFDVISLGTNEYTGTARTMAMGNAFTALGSDIGSITLNPAASAVARYSQITVTPGVSISVVDAMGTTLDGASSPFCFDQRSVARKSRFALPNIGTTINFDVNSGVLHNVTIGFMLNSSKDFNEQLVASGAHYGTSLAGSIAAAAGGVNFSEYNDDDSYRKYPWLNVLGYRSGMISNISDNDSEYVGVTEKYTKKGEGSYDFYVAGPLNQTYGRRKSGSKYDTALNVGFNIADWFFLGANLSFSYFNYSMSEFLTETPVDMNDFDIDFGTSGKTYFKDLKYSYSYRARASALGGKFGFIMTPGQVVRFGAAIQTPSVYTIAEKWGSSAEAHFKDVKFDAEASSPDGEYSYQMLTPLRFNTGLAFNVAGRAILSVDYELCDFRTARLRDESDSEVFKDANAEIRESLAMVHDLRAGVEVKPIPQLALRAGYNLSTNPEKAVRGSVPFMQACSHAGSFGIGYDSGGMIFIDVAAKGLFRPKEYTYPYSDYIFDGDGNIASPTPEIMSFRSLWTAALTLGFRF